MEDRALNNLQSYLNDHLAGSVIALETLDHLIATRENPALRDFLVALRAEIAADRDDLKRLLHQVGGDESSIRKAGAWVAEKFGRVKLHGADDDLGFMQALETLMLGILGKRAMARTLAAAERSGVVELRGFDCLRLERRSEEQFRRVEGEILERASMVLGT